MIVPRERQFNRTVFALSLFVLFTSAFLSAARAADTKADNPELQQIYDVDQKDREASPGKTMALNWAAIGPRDSARRKRVRELIDEAALHTAKDYERAAMVFQHGDGSDDILMAHVLAVTAIGKGDLAARWLAAAALDRFLQRVGQPQVFGTQFLTKIENGKQTWTMEPYNRTLVGPNLRDANCVPDQENQTEALNAISKGGDPKPQENRPCVEH